ncbi:HalOD1 output domain-containing protein [Haloarcula sp. JP-L23]|uniref:HalOD1 output domain-containing protein n=1 Tax=Haloarcula sp. JP-L23 TaxID=2716717 RepID=UPI00140EF906|nr:hypothetical protein G9465_14850 [Haloarcula sp. JP-L23]
MALTSLNEEINPDALDRLFTYPSTERKQKPIFVCFQYCGYTASQTRITTSWLRS